MNAPHFEEMFQRDMDRIRNRLTDMAALAERALRQCVEALLRGDRQLAYAVILRDLLIDAQEKEIDRLCLEFLVREQPAGEPLRFAFSAIKVNLEVERVGDYAESIARQIVRLASLGVPCPAGLLDEIAGLAIAALHDAIVAFTRGQTDLARIVIQREETVDLLKRQLNARLADLFREDRISLDALNALSGIVRQFERVSDQASNISLEALYVCTGRYTKHRVTDQFRILFVDDDGSAAAPLAEAIGAALNQPRFTFTGASLQPRPALAALAEFLPTVGADSSALAPRALNQVHELELYQVVIFLTPGAKRAFPQQAQKVLFLDWILEGPARPEGSPEQVRAALERMHRFLDGHIRDLVNAIVGTDQLKLEGM